MISVKRFKTIGVAMLVAFVLFVGGSNAFAYNAQVKEQEKEQAKEQQVEEQLDKNGRPANFVYTFPTKAPLFLGEWQGRAVGELFDVWGIPLREKTILGSTYVLYQLDKGTISNAAATDLGGGIFVGTSKTRKTICDVTFQIRENSVVIGGQYQGHIKTCKGLLNRKHRPKDLQDKLYPWQFCPKYMIERTVEPLEEGLLPTPRNISCVRVKKTDERKVVVTE